MNKTPLQVAVGIAGSQSELARRINVSQQRLAYWVHRRGGRVPAEYVDAIERACNGRVTRHELRPDLYPLDEPEPADSSEVAA